MLKALFKSVLYQSERFFDLAPNLADYIMLGLAGFMVLTFISVLITLSRKNKRLKSEDVALKMQNNKLYLHVFFILSTLALSLSVFASVLEFLSVGETFPSGEAVALYNLAFLAAFELLNFILYAVAARKNKRLIRLKRINDAIALRNQAAAREAILKPKSETVFQAPMQEPVKETAKPDFLKEFFVEKEECKEKENISQINSVLKKILSLPLSHNDEALVKRLSLIVDEEKYNIDSNLPAEKHRLNEALSGLLKVMAKYSA